VNPTTGGDVMPTIRAEFHRLERDVSTRSRREVGSSVYQVFEGTGTFVLDGVEQSVAKGDMVVVPSWVRFSIAANESLDLFRFSDHPIIERLSLNRVQEEDE
jgi:gentisate 1,2-dioxygenase